MSEQKGVKITKLVDAWYDAFKSNTDRDLLVIQESGYHTPGAPRDATIAYGSVYRGEFKRWAMSKIDENGDLVDIRPVGDLTISDWGKLQTVWKAAQA